MYDTLHAFQIVYENLYKQLAKIRTFVNYSIDAFHGFILALLFVKLNTPDYHRDSLNVSRHLPAQS